MSDTRERWRLRLPHWEVAGRPHFVTVRCAESLPEEARLRVREVHESLRKIAPASPQFAALQRRYFLLCERYLDAGHGFCPFLDREVCLQVVASLDALPARCGWTVTHFALMPNHVHLLMEPNASARPLRKVLRGWKWHVARLGNRHFERTGRFWQTDWFDRWSRSDAETVRIRDYIRRNPVKAGLAARWDDHPWTR